MHQRGFSALELLVTVSLCGLLALIGAPSISHVFGQLRAAEDIRTVALLLITARDEAVRLRTDVQVELTSTGISVDIDGDGTVEDSLALASGSTWEESATTEITFNGLGLARGISGSATLAIKNRGTRATVTVNQNGTVRL
jgi:prepilin-type N-terminal cleavage/methylation domain-containing protein